MPVDDDQAGRQLSALGNPTRIRLFRLLVRAGPGGLTVGEVQRHLGIPASTLAHHLAALVSAGLVDQERQGREVLCTAAFSVMHGLIAYLTDECCRGVEVLEEGAGCGTS